MPKRRKPVNPFELMRTDFEFAAQWQRSREVMMEIDYRPLFQKWDLPDDVQRGILEVLAKHFRTTNEIAWASPLPRSEEAQAAVDALLEQAAAARDAELKALLGADRQAEFAVYRRELPARRFVHGLAGLVAFTDPLSASQADRLTILIAEASSISRLEKQVNFTEMDWSMLDEQAAKILSPTQYAVWRSGMVRDLRGGRGRAHLALTKAYEEAVAQDEQE